MPVHDVRDMLAWSLRREQAWGERRNMSKTAAGAAVSTKCGFTSVSEARVNCCGRLAK